jgi:hypothetical protein
MAEHVQAHFWTFIFYSIVQSVCFYIDIVLVTIALQYSLKSGIVIPLALLFLLKIAWLFGVFCVSI